MFERVNAKHNWMNELTAIVCWCFQHQSDQNCPLLPHLHDKKRVSRNYSHKNDDLIRCGDEKVCYELFESAVSTFSPRYCRSSVLGNVAERERERVRNLPVGQLLTEPEKQPSAHLNRMRTCTKHLKLVQQLDWFKRFSKLNLIWTIPIMIERIEFYVIFK